MALFSKNKAAPAAEKETKTATATRPALPTDRDLASVIKKPRVTEKAVGKSEQNVYTFEVRRDATKYDVRDAVIALFNVTPVKVNIVNKRPRRYHSRTKGRTVSEPGLKKAYVYLKSGDSITIV
jgi:large subunit ribosomal protein L23